MKTKRPKKKTAKQLNKIVDDFNAAYPVGAKVMLRNDIGEWSEKTVRAPAEVLQGHSAVGWFEEIRGCYSIEDDRVGSVGAE